MTDTFHQTAKRRNKANVFLLFIYSITNLFSKANNKFTVQCWLILISIVCT